MQNNKKEFVAPPECPVFEPSWDEFRDPLAYIAKIRSIGEQYGLIKIRTPSSWQPPFAIDVETFKFTPRIQKLNELEALSRVKLNFLDQLTKFWKLQGITLKIPMIDGKTIDLYTLQKIVTREGGFEAVNNKVKQQTTKTTPSKNHHKTSPTKTTTNLWCRVAQMMGYSMGRGCETMVSHTYETIIHPYDLFVSGMTLTNKKKLNKGEIKKEFPVRKMKKMRRMASNLPCYQAIEEKPTKSSTSNKSNSQSSKSSFMTKADHYFCEVCEGGDDESLMLLCEGCDMAYHTYCLVPPLHKVPPGDWLCPSCISKEICRPMEAYGFEQSQTEYTLEMFGQKADSFKENHFKMAPQKVAYGQCEKEFWRLVACLEEDVSVEYGADIHSGEQGSGFPTERSLHLFSGEDANNIEEYIRSGWNLNNLPLLEPSVLKHISVDISGMKVPWVYVGMCFSSFSWHIEDHWSYSVNYMHWGEPKTWYGVAGRDAEKLEECMMKEVPELFKHQPDLLHQLTTIINPNVLMHYGVPVFRTDQCPGEFVITFPRSYHAGFNQGYNFAEAVNFCPPDWLPLGRECVEQYRKFKRRCVFSHDQLLCEIAEAPDKVNIDVTKAVLTDLLQVATKEAKLRSAAKAAGFMEERFMFNEVENDDDRECHVCKTTCFLSAIYCHLDSGRLICLDHDQSEYGCKCATANHTIRYRYTLPELSQLVDNLRNRSLSLDNWKSKVTAALQTSEDKKNDISHLKDLHQEHSLQNLPSDPLHHHLTAVIHASEQLIDAARLLVNKKINCRLSMEELETFCHKVKVLPCTFKEASLIKDLHDNVLVFQNEVSAMLDSSKVTSSWRLQEVVDWGASLNVDFPELSKLQLLLVQSKWLDEYNALFNNTNTKKLTISLLRKLCENLLINNNSDSRHLHVVYCNAANKVKELLACSEAVELKAQNCLKEGPTIQSLELVIREASVLENVDLQHTEKAKSLLHRAKIWQNLASLQINRGHGLHLDELEELMEEGSNIMVRLDALNVLQNRYKMAVSWKQKVFECFLHPSKNSILQPWFSKLGIRLNFPSHKRENTVLSSDGSFHCPYTAITLDSLQLVVKEMVDKLVVMRNSSTKKLLEHGKSKGTNGLCVCGHNFTNHVKCCVLCTIVYMADCSIFERQHDHQLPQQQQNQANSNLSMSSFNSNKPIGPFSLTNQSMFSTPPSFPLNSVMQGPFHNNQSSSIFGTANSILGPVISSNKNGPGVNLFSPSNQRFPMSNAPFSPSNTGSGMFQWTNSTSQGPFASSYKSPPSQNTNMTQFSSSSGEGGLNVCDSCRHKVHRPRYSELKSLVAGWYSMNGACLPEGRALLYLLDLVNEWQMKAREVLSSRELVVAIGLLDLPLNDQCTQDSSDMAPPIPSQVTQLSIDPILRPRLFSLEVSVSLQTLMADLLVESMALNVETMECVQLRSLIYACYEKIVISESLKKEEEKKKKLVEDEVKRKEEERLKRMMEEKNKRENEEMKRRSLEEMEYKNRLKEEDKRKDAGKMTNNSNDDDDVKQSNAYSLSMFNKNMHGDKFIYDDDEEDDDDDDEEDDDDDISNCGDQVDRDNSRSKKKNNHIKNDERENGRSKVKKNGVKNKKQNKKVVSNDIYSDDDEEDKEEEEESDKDDDYSSVEYKKKLKKVKKTKNTKKSKLESHKKIKDEKISRKNKSQAGRKKKKKRKRSDDDDNDEDNDDDDIYDVVHYTDDEGEKSDENDVAGNKWDICSMPDCLKPTRAKVDWVQCDNCQEWYHLDCVNLSRLPEEHEEYHCPMCARDVKNSKVKDSKNKKGKKQKKEHTSNTPENQGISRKNKNNKTNKKNNEDYQNSVAQRHSNDNSVDKNHTDAKKRSKTKNSPQKKKSIKSNSAQKSRSGVEKKKKNKSLSNNNDDGYNDDHKKKKRKYSPSSSSSSSSLKSKRLSEVTRSYKEDDEDDEEDEEEEDNDDDDDDDYKDYEKLTKNKINKAQSKTSKASEYSRSDSHSSGNSCGLLKSPLVNNNNNDTKSFDSYLYAPWLDKR